MANNLVITLLISALLMLMPTAVLAAPVAPVSSGAVAITQTGFTAGWDPVNGADGYLLDVATDSLFTSYVSGYMALDVAAATSYAVSGLNSGVTYFYRVRAYDNSGTGLNSNTGALVTLPATPSVPVAAAASAVTQSGFTASWSSANGATGYRLDVSLDSGFASFVTGYDNKDVGNVTSSVVSGLAAGTTYYYRVRAYNLGGTSGNSNVTVLGTLPAIPAAPDVTGAISVTQTGFTATWNPSDGATGYRLDVSATLAFSTFVTGYSNKDVANVTSTAVSGLTAGSTYYYRLRAYNAGGTSANSSTAALVTLPLPPAAPAVTPGATSITQVSFSANWVSVAAASGYLFDVATDSGFTAFVSGFNNRDVGIATSYPVSGLTAGTTYYYRVRAYNNGGASINSGTITLTTVPLVPVATAATAVTQTGFTANWDAVSGASGYKLDVATDAAFSSILTSYKDKGITTGSSAVVTGLVAGTSYYYRVRAYTTGGTSASSNVINQVTLATPLAIAATAVSQTGFTATWNPAVGAIGYRLDVATSSAFSTFVAGFSNLDVANTTSAVVSGLAAGTTYYYRVRAYNSTTTSSNSNVIAQSTLSTAVAIAATNVSQTGFNANWNAAGGASGYQLDVATDSAFTSFVSGYNNKDVGLVTTTPVSGLTPGVTYYYRVRAYTSVAVSVNSNTITQITLATPLATAATTITQTGFKATWGAVVGATGYRLDVATDAAFTSILTSYNDKNVLNVTSSAVSSLASGTVYYYRVRAYNVSSTTANSNAISTITIPATPVATAAATVTHTSFTANWNPATGAGGYRLDVATNSTFTALVTGFSNLDVANVTSTTVSGLTSGTAYYYRIRAYNAGGTSGNSNVITQSTLATPVAIAATNVGQTGFNAAWNATGGASGYQLDVASDAGFTTFVSGYNSKDVGNLTTAPVSGLSPGVTYYYRVRAYTSVTTSANSNTISQITLAPPVASAATLVTQTGFTANWGAVVGATGYRLDVATDSAFTTILTGYSDKNVLNVTSSAVSGLTAGTSYYYRVRAVNSSTTTLNSNVINPTTFPTVPVASPATAISQTGFSANWNPATGAVGYRLDVATNSTFTTFVAGFNDLNVANVTTYAVSGLTAGVSYYYRVRAYSAGGTSISSTPVITLITVPLAPVAVPATAVTQTGFKATWGAVGGVGGYRLDLATDAGFTTFVSGYEDKNVLAVTSYSITGLSAGVVYYYRVRSYNSGGTSESSNVITQPTLATPVATPATAITPTGFTATWGAVVGATGYKIDVASNSTFSTFVSGYNSKDVSTATSAVVSGLTAGVTYYYRVRAYSGSVTTTNSNVITQVTLATPLATAATAVTQTGFTASWGAASSATGYLLDVATDAGFLSIVSGYNSKDVANVTSSAVTGLTAGTSYYYRVRSYTSAATSVNSNTISLITLPPTPDAPVAASASAVTQFAFTANWAAVPGATGYFLDVSVDPVFASFVSGYSNRDVLNVTSFVVSGLTGGTTYYYRVRAYNTGGTSQNSGVVNQTTLPATPPAIPVATAATALTTTAFTANWNAVAGADGYVLDVAVDPAFPSLVSGYANKDVGNVTSFVVSGLTPGSTYYYRLRTYNIVGTSANSANITVSIIPLAPLAPVVDNSTLTGFRVSWEAVSGATGYRLDVSTDSGFAGFVTGYNSRDVSNVTAYTVSGLSAGTTYYCRVRAYTAGGAGGNSPAVSHATLPVAPQAAAANSITRTDFNATWGIAGGAAGYQLDVATDPVFTSFVAGYSSKDVGNVTSAAVTGLTPGTTYYYRVRAYTSGGAGANSTTVIQATQPDVSAAPVAAPATNVTASGFTANWGYVFGVSGYRIDVSQAADFSSFIVGYNNYDVGDTNSVNVVGLAPGSAYYYRVRAYNGGGSSVDSNTITVGAVSASLTVVVSGSGGGSVHSDTGGIACISGSPDNCSASYDGSVLVTLSATADSSSIFVGWSGACSGTDTCLVTMDTSRSVTATFDTLPAVRIFDAVAPRYFNVLQEAYAATVDGDVIQLREGTLVGDLLADRPVSVVIRGGFDAAYSVNALDTRLQGVVTLQQGTVRMERVRLGM